MSLERSSANRTTPQPVQPQAGSPENIAAGKQRLEQASDSMAAWLNQFGLDGTNESQLRHWFAEHGIMDFANVPFQAYAMKLVRRRLLKGQTLDKKTQRTIEASDQNIEEVLRDFWNPSWREEIASLKKQKMPKAERERRIQGVLGKGNRERGDMLQKMLLAMMEATMYVSLVEQKYRQQISPQVRKGEFMAWIMGKLISQAQAKESHVARFFLQHTKAIGSMISAHYGGERPTEQPAAPAPQGEVSLSVLQAQYEIMKTTLEYMEELLDLGQLAQTEQAPPLDFVA